MSKMVTDTDGNILALVGDGGAGGPKPRSDGDGLSQAMRAVDETERQEDEPEAQAGRAVEQALTKEPEPKRTIKSERHVLATQTLIQAEGERLQGVVNDLDRRRDEVDAECKRLLDQIVSERDRKVAEIGVEKVDALEAFDMLRAAVTARKS